MDGAGAAWGAALAHLWPLRADLRAFGQAAARSGRVRQIGRGIEPLEMFFPPGGRAVFWRQATSAPCCFQASQRTILPNAKFLIVPETARQPQLFL
jgi:hypothetical protein